MKITIELSPVTLELFFGAPPYEPAVAALTEAGIIELLLEDPIAMIDHAAWIIEREEEA